MRDVWNSGGVAYGAWTTIADPVAVTLVARGGFDYTCVDLQHGMATFGELPTILRYLMGTGTTRLVRVPSSAAAPITRALDLGAQGVVVPMVEDAEEAARAVAAARYPALPGAPETHGRRSWGPIFWDLGEAPGPAEANEEVIVVVMIETPGAFAQIERIAAVPGVDVLYVGPYDFALSSGYGQATYRDNAEVEQRMRRVVDVALEHGKIPAVHCTDLQMVRDWRERGARMLTACLDTTVIAEAFAARLAGATDTGRG
ncbi:MAG: hypothetical protein LBC97_09105 [Bifidobacteriaceae bacterium]|jgi:4-hydroxy-2-oxoheptanedioate aldolase|nr:hypothetical protein [Bifidobacteriaceae bacterium]